MVLDEALEERIWAIVNSLRKRIGGEEAPMRAGARKQAHVPVGAVVLEPKGTAPGFLVGTSPVVAVLPGPPRELQRMWADAVEIEPLAGLLRSAGTLERRILRFFPLSEPQIAATLRELDADALPFEVTTCLRRGELEVATVYRPAEAYAYASFEAAHPRTPRRRPVLRRRRDDRRGHRPRAVRVDGRHGRVLHGWADGGAVDRPRRLLRVRARRAWWCTRTRPRRSSRTLIRR